LSRSTILCIYLYIAVFNSTVLVNILLLVIIDKLLLSLQQIENLLHNPIFYNNSEFTHQVKLPFFIQRPIVIVFIFLIFLIRFILSLFIKALIFLILLVKQVLFYEIFHVLFLLLHPFFFTFLFLLLDLFQHFTCFNGQCLTLRVAF
jgi:hypothetical protein